MFRLGLRTEILDAVPTRLSQDTTNANIWIDEGCRSTASAYAWSFLRRRISLSLATGESSFELPGEAIDPMARLSVTTDTTSEQRIPLIDLDAAKRFYATTDTGQPAYAYLGMKAAGLDPNSKVYVCYLVPAADQAYTIYVDGYFYLPDFTDDNQDNRWTIDYPDMIREYVMLRFRKHRNEYEKAQFHIAEYDRLLQAAIRHDASKMFENATFMRPSSNAGNPLRNDSNDVWGRGSPSFGV